MTTVVEIKVKFNFKQIKRTNSPLLPILLVWTHFYTAQLAPLC